MLEFDLTLSLGGFALRAAARLASTTAILGPSGSGKTSLIETVAGLRRAQGVVRFNHQVLQDTAQRIFLPPEKRHFGYVPQKAALFPHLSVRHNLLFGRSGLIRRRGGEDEEFRDVVAALDLEPLLARFPRYLSGGESRRVALGRALLSRPRLLLLDEPTSGLDPERGRRARGRIRRVSELFGIPLLLVTHRQEDALALAEEVLILDAGTIVASGPTRPILTRREALAHEERSANLLTGRVREHDPEGGVTTIVIDGAPITIPHHADLAVGSEVLLSVDAEEVLLATEEPRGLSARNAMRGEISGLEAIRDSVYVRVGDWLVRLTVAAARDLALAPGRHVWLVVKTHSWRVLAS